MQTRLGTDADEVLKTVCEQGIPQSLVKRAMDIARQSAAFTVYSLVDAMTRLTQQAKFAGDRMEADARVGRLMALAMAV